MPDIKGPALRVSGRPTDTAQSVSRFDYAGLAANVAVDLQERAKRIRHRKRSPFIDVGHELLEAKRHDLEHGKFITWIETECGLNKRSAQRMMQAAAWVQ